MIEVLIYYLQEELWFLLIGFLCLAIPSPLPKLKIFLSKLNFFVSKSKQEMQVVKKDLDDIKRSFKTLEKSLSK